MHNMSAPPGFASSHTYCIAHRVGLEKVENKTVVLVRLIRCFTSSARWGPILLRLVGRRHTVLCPQTTWPISTTYAHVDHAPKSLGTTDCTDIVIYPLASRLFVVESFTCAQDGENMFMPLSARIFRYSACTHVHNIRLELASSLHIAKEFRFRPYSTNRRILFAFEEHVVCHPWLKRQLVPMLLKLAFFTL